MTEGREAKGKHERITENTLRPRSQIRTFQTSVSALASADVAMETSVHRASVLNLESAVL